MHVNINEKLLGLRNGPLSDETWSEIIKERLDWMWHDLRNLKAETIADAFCVRGIHGSFEKLGGKGVIRENAEYLERSDKCWFLEDGRHFVPTPGSQPKSQGAQDYQEGTAYVYAISRSRNWLLITIPITVGECEQGLYEEVGKVRIGACDPIIVAQRMDIPLRYMWIKLADLNKKIRKVHQERGESLDLRDRIFDQEYLLSETLPPPNG